MKVMTCSVGFIKEYVEKYHYSHNINGLKIASCFCLLDDQDVVCGALIFGALSTTAWKKYGKKEEDVVELRRMVVSDTMPCNTNTFFLSKAIKILKRETNFKICISYADPEYGHSGIVYQAANWNYEGMTAADEVLETPDGKRYHSRAMRTKYKGELKPFAKRLKQLDEKGLLKRIKVRGKHIYSYNLKGKQIVVNKNYPKPYMGF